MDQLNITLYGVENSSNFTPTDSILTERNGVREFHDAYKQIHGYLATTICILGVLLNIINIYILTRKSMRSSATNVLLCSLAVADLLTELLYLPFALYFFIVRRDIPVTGHPDGWVYFASISLGGQNISHTAAMWITVAIATFRYIYVCQHTKAHKLCSLKRAYLTIALVGLESCLACMPSLICFTVTDMPHPSANTTIKWIGTATICENNDGLLQKITMLVFGGIIKCSACITLVCFTVRLLYSMREAKKRHDNLTGNSRSSEHTRSTIMLITVVMCFVITEFPQGILVLICFSDSWYFDNVYILLGDFLDVIVLLNSSVNFILYASMSAHFRHTFRTKVWNPVAKRLKCHKSATPIQQSLPTPAAQPLLRSKRHSYFTAVAELNGS